MFTQTFAHIKGLSNEFHDSTEFEYDSWSLQKLIYPEDNRRFVDFRSYKLKDAVSDLKLIAEVVYNAGKNLNIATKGGSLIIKGLVKAKWMKKSLNQSKIETQLELFCPSHEEGGRFGGAGASGEW